MLGTSPGKTSCSLGRQLKCLFHAYINELVFLSPVRPSDPSRNTSTGPNPDRVLAALHHFKDGIPKMVESVISNLELQKKDLKQAFDNAQGFTTYAKSVQFELTAQLVKARLACIENPSDQALGEVRYYECGSKYAEGRVEAAMAKERETLLAFQAHCTKVEDRRKDQWVLEEYFIFK